MYCVALRLWRCEVSQSVDEMRIEGELRGLRGMRVNAGR